MVIHPQHASPSFQAHPVLESLSLFGLTPYWNHPLLSGSSCAGQFSALRNTLESCYLQISLRRDKFMSLNRIVIQNAAIIVAAPV
jgi:hypothetical protein